MYLINYKISKESFKPFSLFGFPVANIDHKQNHPITPCLSQPQQFSTNSKTSLQEIKLTCLNFTLVV